MWGYQRQSDLLLDYGWISPPSLRLPPLCNMTRGNNAWDTSYAWPVCTSSRTSTWLCGTNCRQAMPLHDGPLAWRRLTSSLLRTPDPPSFYGLHPWHACGQDLAAGPGPDHSSYWSTPHCSAQAEAPDPSRGCRPGARAHTGAEEHGVNIFVHQSLAAGEAGTGGAATQGCCWR